MSDTYEMTLMLRKNGVLVGGYAPLVRRLTVDQSQAFDELLASGGGDVALPVSQVSTISVLLVQGDQAQTLKLGNISLGAGGLVLLWNATNTTETIANASGTQARNSGLAGGT
jgi:hypothetical protein